MAFSFAWLNLVTYTRPIIRVWGLNMVRNGLWVGLNVVVLENIRRGFTLFRIHGCCFSVLLRRGRSTKKRTGGRESKRAEICLIHIVESQVAQVPVPDKITCGLVLSLGILLAHLKALMPPEETLERMKEAPIASNVSICRRLASLEGVILNNDHVFSERRRPRSSPSLGKHLIRALIYASMVENLIPLTYGTKTGADQFQFPRGIHSEMPSLGRTHYLVYSGSTNGERGVAPAVKNNINISRCSI